MKTLWMTVGLLLLPAYAAHAATPADRPVEQICAELTCRPGGYEAIVRLDDQHYKTVPVSLSPYVTEDGEILIFPGETFAVQFTILDGKPTAPKFFKAFSAKLPAQMAEGDALSANQRDGELPRIEGDRSKPGPAGLPPESLLISYGQWNGKPGMVMILDQTMAQTLKLDATMFIIETGRNHQQYTSTCPIISNGSSYESWSHDIGPMLLSNFRFLKEGDDLVCK